MVSGRAASAPAPDDQATLDTICNAFTRGMSHKAIAGQLGIAVSTLRSWLEQGRIELESGNELGSLGRLSVAVGKAYYQFESESVAVMADGKRNGGNKWIPALAHVTRVHPAEWAERRDVSITSTVSITITSPELSEAQQRLLLLALADDEPKLLPPGPIDTNTPS